MTPVPRWREVADDLQRRIKAGEFAARGGRAKLPTELELQKLYKVSRNSVRDALAWLAERGRVETLRGMGTFVVARPEALQVTLAKPGGWPGGGEVRDAAVEDRAPSYGEIEIAITSGRADVARYLQLDADAPLVVRRRSLSVDGLPWARETTYYPQELTARAPRLLAPSDIPEGAVAYLEATVGYTQGGLHDEIAVRIPTAEELRAFGLPERASAVVFETIRTAYDEATGRPYRCTVTVWPADRNRLHYNVGQVPDGVVARPSGR